MAHNETVLSQLLNLIERHDFQKLEKPIYAPLTYRTLTRLKQFTAMILAQLTGRAI